MKALALAILLAPSLAVASPYQGVAVSTSGPYAVENLSGYLKVAASTRTYTTPTITLDGPKGGINASSATFRYNVSAGSATIGVGPTVSTFSASGSLVMPVASGGFITSRSSVNAGGFFGDGANLTNITAANVSAGALGASVRASSIAVAAVGSDQIANGSIIGPDIAASTIPPSALNQSGASSGQVMAWNGSAWAPSSTVATLAISSQTSSLFGATSSGSDVFAVTVASLTITTTGGRVAAWFTGTVTGSASQTVCALTVKIDGAFISPFTSAISIWRGYTTTGAADLSEGASFFFVTPTAPSAASHTLALLVSGVNGNCSVDNGSVQGGGSQFGIFELH